MSSCRDEAHDSALKPGAASPTIGPQPTFGMDTAHDPSLHGVGCAVESARRPGGLAKPGARARTESRLRGTGSSAIVSRGPAAGQLRTHSGSHCSCACTPQTGIVRPGGGGGGHAAACGAGPGVCGPCHWGQSAVFCILPLSARLALPPGAAPPVQYITVRLCVEQCLLQGDECHSLGSLLASAGVRVRTRSTATT